MASQGEISDVCHYFQNLQPMSEIKKKSLPVISLNSCENCNFTNPPFFTKFFHDFMQMCGMAQSMILIANLVISYVIPYMLQIVYTGFSFGDF